MSRLFACVGLVLWLSTEALAQGGPVIDHAADECWLKAHFPELAAGIEPGREVQTAKVYFRAEQFPDFYYVEMALQEVPSFVAVLPAPGPSTEKVIYYVEAIDNAFGSARSTEYAVDVEDPCRRRPGAFYAGPDPGIVVGATKAGMAALPPGFQAAGIAGFISAAGISSGVGGGIGLGTAAVVAGAGAAAAGGAVVAAGGSEASTSAPPSSPPAPPPAGSTTSAPSSTTTSVRTSSSTSSVAPASTTSVAPATTTTVPTTTVSSTSTTSASSTSTTTTAAPTTSSTSTTTSVSTTSTISTTTTTALVPPVTACFTAVKLNSCVWRFDASCSTGPIVQYLWLIDVAGNMPPPRPLAAQSGQVVVMDWNPPPFGGCSGSPTITVQLTVVGSLAQTDVKSQNHSIDLTAPEPAERRSSLTSLLEAPNSGGGRRGFVMVNRGRADTTESSVPFRHLFSGVPGRNTLEAFPDAADGGESYWKFDFATTPSFVPGSLRVERGTAIHVGPRTVVLRLGGTTGERVELSFELEP